MAPQVKSKSGSKGNRATKKISVKANRLMVWGDNSARQISDAPTGRVRVVAGGSVNGLALLWNWKPVLWGKTVDELPPNPPKPPGTKPIPQEIDTKEFKAIGIGRNDAVLIRQNNKTLVAFGHNQPVLNVPAGKYSAVTVAAVHAVAIAQDGTLKAWGSNSYTDTSVSPPLTVTGFLNAPKGGPFKQVSARVLYSLALKENGTLYGWGNGSGAGYNIFNGWTPTTEDPKIFCIPDQKFNSIAAGNDHAIAIRKDGTVTGWGKDEYKKPGGALEAPPQVLFKAIAAGCAFSIGLSTDKTLWGWGKPYKLETHILQTEDWTFATKGWTRYNETEYYYVPNIRFKSIAAAAFHIMAITGSN